MEVRQLVGGLILVGEGFLCTSPAFASTFEPVSDAQLVCEATDVVHGRITDVQSAWDDGRTAIWTTATVQIDGTNRGQLPRAAVVRVKEVSGTVGDYTIKAEGFPTFQQGSEVVLFLRPWEDGTDTYRVWGYGRGMFLVARGQGHEPTTQRYDVAESGGQPTMFTDRIPPTIVLEALNHELDALARTCKGGGRP